MSSWFDSQVYELRQQIPFVSPSLLSFIDGVIYNEGNVVLTCQYRGDVKTSKWFTLSWTESDGSQHEVSSQEFSLLLWRAVQVHLNTQEKANPKKHAYIDAGCTECALAGKPLKPYHKDGHYYGHHCDEHMPKDADTNAVKLFVNIGDKEYDLLDLIYTKDQPILDLERAGYLQAIGKLQACEFAYDYFNKGISYLRITQEGREFLEEREVNGDTN